MRWSREREDRINRTSCCWIVDHMSMRSVSVILILMSIVIGAGCSRQGSVSVKKPTPHVQTSSIVFSSVTNYVIEEGDVIVRDAQPGEDVLHVTKPDVTTLIDDRKEK